MTRTFGKIDAKMRRQKYADACSRPELFWTDGFARAAPSGPISAPVKVQDADTRRMIDEALARRAAS